jgi:hypothetical protein
MAIPAPINIRRICVYIQYVCPAKTLQAVPACLEPLPTPKWNVVKTANQNAGSLAIQDMLQAREKLSSHIPAWETWADPIGKP